MQTMEYNVPELASKCRSKTEFYNILSRDELHLSAFIPRRKPEIFKIHYDWKEEH